MRANTLTSQTRFALEAFLLDGQSRNLRPRTLEFYKEHLTWFFVFAAENNYRQIEDINPHIIRAYLVYLQQERQWKPSSVHGAARAIRVFFAFCVRDEMITHSPMAKVKMPAMDQPRKPPFADDEIRRLLTAADCQRDRALLLCLLDSGCRASEFVAWTVGDVNLATGAVHLRHTKNRKSRTVYLGNRARKELVKYFRELPSTDADAPIWISGRTGDALLTNGLRQLLRRIGARAKVKPVGPHRFRHTFAISYLRNGGDIFTLQRLLGHSSLEMVKRYLALDVGDLEQAHKRFGVVDRLSQR